jgi:hypothetical protein
MPSERNHRKSDLARALAAAADAGLTVVRFEVTKGKIIVFAGTPEQDETGQQTSQDLRKLL